MICYSKHAYIARPIYKGEGSLLATLEEARHDILLIVIIALVILFAVGLVVAVPAPPTPIIVP
jgi:hypothetical protein